MTAPPSLLVEWHQLESMFCEEEKTTLLAHRVGTHCFFYYISITYSFSDKLRTPYVISCNQGVKPDNLAGLTELWCVRPHSLYSLVDGSRQWCPVPCRTEKNKNKKFQRSIFFLVGDNLHIVVIFWQKYHRLGKKKFFSSCHVGGKNKKTSQVLVFFSFWTLFQHIRGLVNRRI